MPRRIAIVSQKGGVGKTTVCLNLALALAERGRRTLLVDLDPQGGVGHSLAKGDGELIGLADVLAGQVSVEQAVLPTHEPGLSLLPRGRLDPVDVCELELMLHAPGRLEAVLAEADAGFDLTLIDTPSGLGMPTRAALRVADYVLVPLQTERLALRSVAVLVDAWNDLTAVLDTIVPRHGAFAQASEAGIPLGFLGGAPSPEARRFDMLAEEVEVTMARLGGKELGHDRPRRSLL